MKKVFIFLSLSMVLIMDLDAQTLPEKETGFTDQVSSMLNGATVMLKKKAPVYEISIDHLVIDTAREARSWLFAGSMPALVFLKDSIRSGAAYKLVEIRVKSTGGKEKSSSYSFRQLNEVAACLSTASRYANGLITTNVDSVTYYSEAALVRSSPPSALVEKLRAADDAWGRVEDMNINGFRVESANGKDIVYVSIYLERNVSNQLVELWINPVTRKVVKIDL